MKTKFKVGNIIQFRDEYYTIMALGVNSDKGPTCYVMNQLKGFGSTYIGYLEWHIRWTDIHCNLAPESIRLLYGA